MLIKSIIRDVNEWLDRNVGVDYLNQPLAQDWARVAKVTEEAGEAVSELILWTGQNPRKPLDLEARDRLMNELADVVMTGVLAIQHFTNDVDVTETILIDRQLRTRDRMFRHLRETGQ